MTQHLHPPPGWPQRRRECLPFPPGMEDARFEVFIDAPAPGEREVWHINLRSGEAFRRLPGGWMAPGWLEMPPRVRSRVWNAVGG